ILFLGKPFDARDGYWEQFQRLIDEQLVRHHPHVGSEAAVIALLKAARGYVQMSRFENWSLATDEAAAGGLPLLLPDLRWARERFGDQATYWPRKRETDAAVERLRDFYQRCPGLPSPKVRFYSWGDVAERLTGIYREVLSNS